MPRGFSLIEVAMVLLIVTLLIGSLLVPFATQIEQRRIEATQKAMQDIREALVGFALTHGRLPRPACPGDLGLEHASLDCGGEITLLPWATLGVARTDAWGRLFRYRVDEQFATAITLDAPGSLDVATRDVQGKLVTIGDKIAAIVWSAGPNGYGARDENERSLAPPPARNADEGNNASPKPRRVVTRPLKKAAKPCRDAPGQPLCEFDDLVDWLSPHILKNRLVAAGRLP